MTTFTMLRRNGKSFGSLLPGTIAQPLPPASSTDVPAVSEAAAVLSPAPTAGSWCYQTVLICTTCGTPKVDFKKLLIAMDVYSAKCFNLDLYFSHFQKGKMRSPVKKKRQRGSDIRAMHKLKTNCPVKGCLVKQKRMNHLRNHFVSMVLWDGDNLSL